MPVSKLKVKSQKSKVEVKKTVSKKLEEGAVKTVSLSAPVFSVSGEKSGSVTLPKEVFGAKINKTLMAQAVRVYLANQRLGTVSTKTRGEVEGSSRKIYKQKGTGRARHGGVRAPIFVKGGVAHGPKPRDYSLKLPQKMKRAALISALSQKQKDGEIKVLSGLEKIEPKTKIMGALINKVSEQTPKSRVLLVTSANPKDLGNVFKSSRNIKNVEVLNALFLNVYEVLKHKNLLLMKEAIAVLEGSRDEIKKDSVRQT